MEAQSQGESQGSCQVSETSIVILPAEKENKIQEKEEKSPDISQAKETVPNNTQTREAVSLDITQVVLDTGKEGVPNEKVTSSSVNTTSDTFPTELADFGYELRDGRLRSITTGEPFQFDVRKGDKTYNQRHYEALGEVITLIVYDLLITETHLKKHIIPVDVRDNEPSSFFFATEDAFSNTEKLMVLIHGSGVVRAGQWARSLIINDCLDSGTQLPFIKRAVAEGYGVIVLNGNRNYEDVDGKKHKIRVSKTTNHLKIEKMK